MAVQRNPYGLEAVVTVDGIDYNTYNATINDETREVDATNSSDYDPVTGRVYGRIQGTQTVLSGEFTFNYDANNTPEATLASGLIAPFVITRSRNPLHQTSGVAFIKAQNWTSGGRDGIAEVHCTYQFQGKPTIT
jgi:hypothetical protein